MDSTTSTAVLPHSNSSWQPSNAVHTIWTSALENNSFGLFCKTHEHDTECTHDHFSTRGGHTKYSLICLFNLLTYLQPAAAPPYYQVHQFFHSMYHGTNRWYHPSPPRSCWHVRQHVVISPVQALHRIMPEIQHVHSNVTMNIVNCRKCVLSRTKVLTTVWSQQRRVSCHCRRLYTAQGATGHRCVQHVADKQRTSHQCYSNARYKMTQHRQYRGRPPLTDDGGVAGAKYACTLSSGRRACSQ